MVALPGDEDVATPPNLPPPMTNVTLKGNGCQNPIERQPIRPAAADGRTPTGDIGSGGRVFQARKQKDNNTESPGMEEIRVSCA